MKTIAYIKHRFYVSVLFLAIMSSTFLFVPISNAIDSEFKQIADVIISSIFWLSLISSIACLTLAYRTFKRINKYTAVQAFLGNSKLGVVTFFANVPAKIFDISLFLMILAAIITNLTQVSQTTISYGIIFVLVLSFSMHCMFNGKIYKITKYKQIRRQDENAKS